MGSEVVRTYIGIGKVEFSIHKQLLLSAGHIFSEMFPPGRKSTERVTLGKEDPHIFKLFVEYLYTKTVPRVHGGMNAQASAKRLHDLCQLYAFSDKFQLEFTICNKIMDTIQDSFYFLGTLPDISLVNAVYQNTPNGSKLREFCISSLLYCMPSREDVNPDILAGFLVDNREALRDFVHSVKRLDVVGRDPRIRDCQGERGCIECAIDTERLKDKHGTWPCQYHIHSLSQSSRVKIEGELPGSGVDADEGCYLWGA
jgi:hypothetical protein